MERQRSREAELSALFETARDLTAIRDLDAILAAIVRRARQLLHADMTYLSLNDELEGASYMKVTDGALTPEFRELRLPLGTGLLGLVAQSGAPYFTEDYQADERFVHRDYIDTAVEGEQIRAILGVPLTVEGKVIGALLAVHRTVRPFPAGEVALLTSFAAHAAIALENARLFEQARAAVAAADEANAELRARSEATERAAHAHDLLTDVLLHGGGVVEVGDVLAEVLGGRLAVYDDEGRLLAGDDATDDRRPSQDAVDRAKTSGRSVQTEDGAWVAVAAAGDEHLGTLVLRTAAPLDLPERRTLERGALVTALVLLFGRIEAEAESRVRGELLSDLVGGRDLDPDRLRQRARQQGADLDGDLVGRGRPARRRRRRRCRSPASRRASLAKSRRPRRDPRRARRWCSVTTSRSVWGGAARATGRRHRRGRHRRRRSGWHHASLARGPADARGDAPAGPHGRGQRPGRARARAPAARRATAPRTSRSSSTGRWDRCCATTPSATPSWPRPWRRGWPPAAPCGRPPSGCTSTRTR